MLNPWERRSSQTSQVRRTTLFRGLGRCWRTNSTFRHRYEHPLRRGVFSAPPLKVNETWISTLGL